MCSVNITPINGCSNKYFFTTSQCWKNCDVRVCIHPIQRQILCYISPSFHIIWHFSLHLYEAVSIRNGYYCPSNLLIFVLELTLLAKAETSLHASHQGKARPHKLEMNIKKSYMYANSQIYTCTSVQSLTNLVTHEKCACSSGQGHCRNVFTNLQAPDYTLQFQAKC